MAFMPAMMPASAHDFHVKGVQPVSFIVPSSDAAIVIEAFKLDINDLFHFMLFVSRLCLMIPAL